MNKYLLLILSALFAVNANAAVPQGTSTPTGGGGPAAGSTGETLDDTFSMYKGYDFEVQFGECLDMQIRPSVGICPGGTFYPPYPSPALKYTYNDIVAVVEVVPDPWKSYLYEESLYDFSSKSEDSFVNKVGFTPTVGAGYGGSRKVDATSEVAQFKYESHVWAVSDWWRFKSDNFIEACFSLTCQNKDYTGCIFSVMSAVASVGEGMKEAAAGINAGEGADGKGQGVKQGDTVAYENGEVYEKNPETGQYEQVRPAGNYGDSTFGRAADVAMSEDIVPGMSNVEVLTEGIALAENPEGYVAGKSLQLGGEAIADAWAGDGEGAGGDDDAWALERGLANQKGSSTANQMKGGSASPLPSSTKRGGQSKSQPTKMDSSAANGKNSAQAGNAVSDNAMGNNTPGNNSALSQMQNGVSAQGLDTMLSIIDRVVYFSVIEIMIQMIAIYSPVLLHPVFMTERHKKASQDGGFFWSPLMQQFAEMGAGLIMPLFCMSKILTMGVDGVAGLLMGSDFNILSMLGPIGSFIESRCVGSWGPLEPRVNLLGTGDGFVAAGLASVRGLNIAQSVTGSMFNKTINNTPFYKLKFNLDFPHTSSCYGFQGFSGLSRGWTTPLGGLLDNVSSVVESGDASAMGNLVADNTIGHAQKQGGYVFTYWRNRSCKFIWWCNRWQGDTGK
tara:strand:- start:1837 stop:3855 length:2019 start_codon:yes stop_codon:yes gene_type:complete